MFVCLAHEVAHEFQTQHVIAWDTNWVEAYMD